MRLATLLAVGLAASVPASLAAQASHLGVLADRYVAGIYEFFPEQAAFSGLANAPADRLGDNSLAAARRWQLLEDSLATALEALPRPAVGSADWVTHGFLRAALGGGRASRVCRNGLWPVNQAFGWQASMAQLAALQPVGSDSARDAAVARWHQLPRYVRTESVASGRNAATNAGVESRSVGLTNGRLSAGAARSPSSWPITACATLAGAV